MFRYLKKLLRKIKSIIKIGLYEIIDILSKSKPRLSFTYNNHAFSFICFGRNDDIFKRIKVNRTFYELEILEYIKNNIKNPGIFIDIGANIGNHTIYFAQVCNARLVYSYE